MQVNTVPPALRPFQTLGMDIDQQDGKDEVPYADCPLCGEEKCFSFNVADKKGQCVKCKTSYNSNSFLGLFYARCLEETGEADWRELAADRRLLSWRTLRQWGLCKNLLTDEWMIPTWKAEGKVGNLYRYTPLDGKMAVLGLPDTHPGMFGLFLPGVYDPARKVTYQCEGVWDAMALWEVLRQARIDDDGSLVQGVTDTLSSSCNVLGVPGCGVWEKPWSKVFKGHTFTLCYDSDHPKVNPKTEQLNEPAGYASMRRVAGLLRGVGKDGPESIRYLSWGKEGYDPELPSGFDVRDLLTSIAPSTLPGRVLMLGELLSRIVDAPEDWKPIKHGEESLIPKACSSWKVLQGAWRRAMNWTEGLDTGLAVVLASCMSVDMTDDLLWVKFIAPPSTGKSSLAEAIAVSQRGVKAVSTLNGLYSGYRVDKEAEEDHSLMAQIKGKCLVVKDADTLLRAPNKEQILSQLRDAYDKVARSNFKIKNISRDYADNPFSCIFFGTPALRELDTESDLGLRFLDYVMMEEIDDEVERATVEMVTSRAISNWGVTAESNGHQCTEEDRKEAMRLTGGYLDYLRENYQTLLGGITITAEAKAKCETLAVFTSHMRARPSDSKEATAQREYAPRLALQLLKLAACVTVVTGKDRTDRAVLKAVAKVARDTARGRTLEIARHLYRCGKAGSDIKALTTWTGHKPKDEQDLLQFLLDIGAVERFLSPAGKLRWRLSEKMTKLYREAMK